MTKNSNVELLLTNIDEAYAKKAWHGPNLRGSIRGLTEKEASWRPGKGRHNIWENVVHSAYWKYIVRRRILEEKRGSFPLKGSNWFPRPAGRSMNDWRDDVVLLGEMHTSLRKAIEKLSDADLEIIPAGSKVSHRAMISGIQAHDVYHAGQIQLMKRLMK